MTFYDMEAKEKQAKIDKEDKYIKARNIADLQKLLRLPEFRRFVWNIWSDTGIFRDPFSQNAMTMSYVCGQQSVGKKLLADVNEGDVNAFGQIQREFISEQKSKETAEKKEEEKKEDA
jgi:hypothetical protein